MIIVVSFLAAVAFIWAFFALGVTRIALNVLNVTQEAVSVIRDRGVDAVSREKAVQRASVRLFVNFLALSYRLIFIMLLTSAPFFGGVLVGVIEVREIGDFLFRWDVMLIGTSIFCFALWIRSKV